MSRLVCIFWCLYRHAESRMAGEVSVHLLVSRGRSRIFERGALFWKSIGAGSKGATGARAPQIF